MRFVSWNIHWGCGKDGRIRIHAIIDVLKRLNPDIICLQEVAVNHPELEGNASADQHRQLAGAFGGYQAVYAPTSEIYKNNLPRLFGNMLLSRLRIGNVVRHSLPWPADPGGTPGMPRGAIEAVVDAPGGKLRVVTTHLEYYSEHQRAAQLHYLAHLQRDMADHARLSEPDPTLDAPFQLGFRPESAVYCGDFNCTPDALPLRQFGAANERHLGALLHDAWRLRHGNGIHAPTAGLHGFAWPDRAGCYDYFFVTNDLAPRVTDMFVQSETAASDHQPIVLDLH